MEHVRSLLIVQKKSLATTMWLFISFIWDDKYSQSPIANAFMVPEAFQQYLCCARHQRMAVPFIFT